MTTKKEIVSRFKKLAIDSKNQKECLAMIHNHYDILRRYAKSYLLDQIIITSPSTYSKITKLIYAIKDSDNPDITFAYSIVLSSLQKQLRKLYPGKTARDISLLVLLGDDR
jgi:hypothetical protein